MLVRCLRTVVLVVYCLYGVSGLQGQIIPDNDLLKVDIGITQIYQFNAHGGISTSDASGRYTGSVDIEMELDLQKLMDIKEAKLFMLCESSWPDAQGIDPESISSYYGVNADAAGSRAIDIAELWYQQNFMFDTLRLRIGKIDLTGGFDCHGCPVSFDCTNYANDETANFMNNAFVNNPSIAFPDPGLGIAGYFELSQSCYLSIAIADAGSDIRETGFSTIADGQEGLFYIAETGMLFYDDGILDGALRVGLWHDQEAELIDDDSGATKGATGMYLSMDHEVYNENDIPNDTQGLAVFARYGLNSGEVLPEITDFYSMGLQYQGFFGHRDNDILGLGIAYGDFSRDIDYLKGHETVIELYYDMRLSECMSISPDLQYIDNSGARDSLVAGVRMQLTY